MNSDETLYSQGFNLIEFFGGAGGGGHHILTNRPPQSEFSFKALSPTVPLVVTSSPHSYYLKGKSSDYPTLALDADGNERASIYLRQSDLNVLHILFQQLLRKDLARELRPAIVQGFFATIERNRTEWMKLLSDVDEEISAIRRSAIMTDKLRADEVRYKEYLLALHNLLTLPTDKFDPSRYKIEQLIPTGHSDKATRFMISRIMLSDSRITVSRFTRTEPSTSKRVLLASIISPFSEPYAHETTYSPRFRLPRWTSLP
jgi:hypothetical protein